MTPLKGLCQLSRCHSDKQILLWQEGQKNLHSESDISPENFHYARALKLIVGNRLHMKEAGSMSATSHVKFNKEVRLIFPEFC